VAACQRQIGEFIAPTLLPRRDVLNVVNERTVLLVQ
jgi:hypothetical protein